MLTRLVVRNFKVLEDVDIELGQNVVFIGPDNSDKTSALQALALWQTGVWAWAGRGGMPPAQSDELATINRRDLTHTPVRGARLLWRNLPTLLGLPGHENAEFVSSVPLRILVGGQSGDEAWQVGVEFLFANSESIYCRPMPGHNEDMTHRVDSPLNRHGKIAFLPPMSGLAVEEEELQPGRVNVLVGEGQTARVLRNLCLAVLERSPRDWELISGRLRQMFGVERGLPKRDPLRGRLEINTQRPETGFGHRLRAVPTEGSRRRYPAISGAYYRSLLDSSRALRGTVELTYRENDIELDIASAGRGLQQTLLLLAHMHANPGATLLLDEPDAHLEVLRQREIYNVLTESARASGSQLIMASHSEIVLDEAADRDVVIAFVGKPHRINNQGAQLKKALTAIGFEQYAQALLKPGVLYLEGPTDLAMLQAFAERLQHPAREALREPFAHYVGNQPGRASEHFIGLREAKPELQAFALFDRREYGLPAGFAIPAHCWRRREIENYVPRNALLRFAAGPPAADLIAQAENGRRTEAMAAAIAQVEGAQEVLGRDAWGHDVKASEEVLPAVFRLFYKALGLRNEMNEADFHELVTYLEPAEIDPEVASVLDMIDRALRAAP